MKQSDFGKLWFLSHGCSKAVTENLIQSCYHLCYYPSPCYHSFLSNKAGVPQESVVGSRLFLLYMNDLCDVINSICKIFPDDTSIFSKAYDIKSQ